VISSVIGLWNSYAPEAAAIRFAFLSASAVGFRWILRGGRRAQRTASKGLACLGLVVSGFILLGLTAKFAAADLLGGVHRWLPLVESQLPAALVVLGMPFMLAEWRIRNAYGNLDRRNFWTISMVLAVGAVAFSGSTASHLAILLWAGLELTLSICEPLARPTRKSSGVVLAVGAIAPAAVAAAVLSLVPGPKGWLAAFVRDSGRLEVAEQAVNLLQDFPVSGGGLGTIPGLYAHYIHGLPVLHIPHTHNLYLNIAIELGVGGLIALLVIYAGALWFSVRAVIASVDRSRRYRFTALATFCGMALALAIGVIDDPYYATWGMPFLLVIPALALSPAFGRSDWGGRMASEPIVPMWVLGVVLLPIIALAAGIRAELASRWYSNFAALEMARVELRGWPTGKWSEGNLALELGSAEANFQRALQLDPENRTSLHRLGLIAMERREYELAVQLLEQALELDPGHTGVRKAFGYSLVWTGEYERAETLLFDITEAQRELGIYQDWWARRGRLDLPQHSAAMMTLLSNH